MISITYQKLLPLFAKIGSKPFDYVHQVYVPNNSSSHVDFAAIDSHDGALKVHSLLEIKWSDVEKEFPESEVTACGSLFRLTGASHQPWIPVLVLSKSHLQIGVAFAFVGGRWAYSEIFKLDKRADFSVSDEGDVLSNLRFALFFCQSAEYHRESKDLCDTKHLVDRNGRILLEDAALLGNRVIVGVDERRKRKILKFYACKADAEKALAVEKLAPGYAPGVAELAEGCADDGMYAVLDDFHESRQVTYRHLIDLTRKVENLWKAGWVQGDLRLPNVIFGPGDVTTIIDWEWAGLVGNTMFPSNVRKNSFGPDAISRILPGELIPANFDLSRRFAKST
uniref:Aminoglycoside phosphotransferase domain-containing protein n=1 Tax=Cryptomonas curvata TaxID=233186 RepID=A0A7S0NAJ0_9CRYP|mmetsp:Transcript_946/g.2025  ORF Transcript_946/g.2025 Transcript_946/m.2025 type:complete len:338 (+) Transcript_946:231-1244(+)